MPIPATKKCTLLDRYDLLIAAGVFTAAMVLYVRTLATTLLLGDSGEFQVLGWTLGLAHPTGYPVYLLLGKLFLLLVPAGDLPYRMNLFSAFAGSLALALVYLLARALGGWRVAALAGAVTLALSRLFWWHAVIAEVYDPATAVLALILLLLVLWRRTGNKRLLFWAGLAGGLSLGIHYSVVLAAPAVLLYLALSARRGERRAAWLRAGAGALAGAAITFGALLALALVDAPTSWLHTVLEPGVSVLDVSPQQAASPVGRAVYLAVGRQFQGELFTLPRRRVLENAAKYGQFLTDQFPREILALAGLGLLVLLAYPRRKDALRWRGASGWREALLFILAWAALYFYAINYDIGDDYVFYIPGYVLLAAAAGVGGSALLDLLAWLLSRARPLAGRPAALLAGLVGLAFIAAAVLPLSATVQKSWDRQRITFLDNTDLRYYPYPVQDPKSPLIRARSIARKVPDNAIIFTDWSMIYPILYVTHFEQGRTGIMAHETYPAMKPHPFADSALAYIRAKYPDHAIFFTDPVGELDPYYNYVPDSSGVGIYRLMEK